MVRNAVIALAIVGGVALVLELTSQVHHSQKGYTLEYPARWEVASPQTIETVREGAAKRGDPSSVNTNLDLILLRAPRTEPTYLTVSVIDGETQASDEAKADLLARARRIAENTKSPLKNYTLREESVGDLPGFWEQYDFDDESGVETHFEFRTSRAGKSYVFTGMASREQFPELDSLFRSIISSLRAPVIDREPGWVDACSAWAVLTLLLCALWRTPARPEQVKS